MKVAICCIGKLENDYIREYADYYQNLGVDNIILYDNNEENGEHFEDVINDYIDSGYVILKNYRGKKACQLEAYQECYNEYKNEYDWILFIDIDEYLTFEKKIKIKQFLRKKCFNGFDMIHINWKVYGDNNLITKTDGTLIERFKEPRLPLDFKRRYLIPENNHIKSIIRGGLKEVVWNSTPHTPTNNLTCCNALGKVCASNSPFLDFDFSVAYLRHYSTKSLEEWCNNKMLKGLAATSNDKEVLKYTDLSIFFNVNELTKEKKDWLKEHNILSDNTNNNLDIFIYTHRDFDVKVSNNTYKIISQGDILKNTYLLETINDEETDNNIKEKTYGYCESSGIYYVWKNVPLKDYVGFCHYRKYFSFFDNIPDMEETFKNFDVIHCKPINLGQDNIYSHYARHHRKEDLDLINLITIKLHPTIEETLINTMNSNQFIPYNMFIMRKEDFYDYCEFIFGIMWVFDKFRGFNNDNDIKKYVTQYKEEYLKDYYPNNTIEYQTRLNGYLIERLTNIYIRWKFTRQGMVGVAQTETKYTKEEERN